MSDIYAAAVERLSHVAGVQAALVVESEAAVPVAAEVSDGVDGTAAAALAASLFRRSTQASEAAQFGRLESLQLEADGGHVVAVSVGDVILVVVTDRNAQVGLVRLEAVRTAQTLA